MGYTGLGAQRQRVLTPRRAPRGSGISRDEIADLLQRTGDLAQLAINADPKDKAGLYRQLGLTMTYFSQKHEVEAHLIPEPPHARSVRVRGRTKPVLPNPLPPTRHPAVPGGAVTPQRGWWCYTSM